MKKLMHSYDQSSQKATPKSYGLYHCEAGNYLVKNGSPFDGVYYIYSGAVELLYQNEAGFLITEIKKAGDVIGEDNLASDTFLFDALALEDTEVCFFDINLLFSEYMTGP